MQNNQNTERMLRMPYTLAENTQIANNTWLMKLLGDASGFKRPGQFVQFKVPGFYLRRPLSVCDWDKQSITLIYKVVGNGTDAMTHMQKNDSVDLLTGLGNGFNVKACTPLLIGGGCGVPPLYKLCRKIIHAGCRPTVILGFNSKEDVFFEDEFRALGTDVTVSTVDGSYAVKGYVTGAIPDLPFDYVYTCGPEPMLKAVFNLCGQRGISGQFSLEERMACGFGACMGCTIQTASGPKRVCADGPVFEKEELLW
jgi:dihydroorotate dehydrogenase electron transfer subunit